MSTEKKSSPESIVRQIKRRTRRKYSAEEKIRIVLEGLRGEQSIADLASIQIKMKFFLLSFQMEICTSPLIVVESMIFMSQGMLTAIFFRQKNLVVGSIRNMMNGIKRSLLTEVT